VNKGAIDSLADQLAACSSGNILNFVNMITLKLNFLILFSNFLRWWEIGPSRNSSEFNVFMTKWLFLIRPMKHNKLFFFFFQTSIFPTRQRCQKVLLRMVCLVEWLSIRKAWVGNLTTIQNNSQALKCPHYLSIHLLELFNKLQEASLMH
jgi:hypothetical protein